MAKLTSAERNKLPSSDFAYPKTRSYPIEDEAHARDALARAVQHGNAVEAHVAAAVRKKFPGIEVTDSH